MVSLPNHRPLTLSLSKGPQQNRLPLFLNHTGASRYPVILALLNLTLDDKIRLPV
jgi:hypothetical protein